MIPSHRPVRARAGARPPFARTSPTLASLTRVALAAALVAPTLAGCGADPAPGPESALTALAGTWADPAPYAYGEAFGHRTFTFDDGRWSLDFRLALDPGMEAPVFRFRTHGAFEILGPSPTVDGAFEAVFTEEAKYLTLETPDPGLAAAFGLDRCGLVPGVEADVSAAGCALWKPVAECGEDHDLLAPAPGGGLRFGVRPPDNDMCTPDRRPTALTPAVMPAG